MTPSRGSAARKGAFCPILQTGGGREAQWTLLEICSSASPPPPLRNQAAPALRRTKPHNTLLFDKTTWKKSANYRPDLLEDLSLLRLDFGTVQGERTLAVILDLNNFPVILFF